MTESLTPLDASAILGAGGDRAAAVSTEDGVRWHVDVKGDGPEMLLVHGTGASSHSFRDLVPILAERFTVIIPDLPGHGRSVAPRGFDSSLPGMASALDRLMRVLRRKPRVAVGHSAGAAILTRMTIDGLLAPALLVGLAAALAPLAGFERRVFPPTARVLAAAAQLFSLRLTERSVVEGLLASTGSVLPDAGLEHYTRLFAQPQHVSAVLAMMAHWDVAPLFVDLRRLETPLVLIAGRADRAVSLSHQEAVLRRAPSATLQVVDGVGHLLHEERPGVIAGMLLREADFALGRGRQLGLGAA